jgi:ribosomal protein S18 acetylase RimI-like enzyme
MNNIKENLKLKNLMECCFNDQFDLYFIDNLINENNNIGIYDNENNLIAFLFYGYCDEMLTIKYIGVHPTYRRNHLASLMIENFFKYISNQNIYLKVKTKNTIAQNLYTKKGFRYHSILYNYYEDDDGYLMVKYN